VLGRAGPATVGVPVQRILSGQRTLPLSSCSSFLNGMSGGGRAMAGWSCMFGSLRPHPPPNCSTEITQEIFVLVPGSGISTDCTPRLTHSASNDSLGTQYLSNEVGV